MSSLSATVVASRGDFVLDVALELEAGETVALVGPNGGGKTTLVEALCGLLPLDSGEVRVGGTTWESTARAIRLPPQARSVGVMFQGLLLLPALSVLDNVAYGVRARGFSRREARSRASDVLARFDAGELAPRMPSSLSGGQAQRVALARALAVRPDLLLLDEPMSALDVAHRADARRALRRALDEFEGAKLVVTHEPVEAMALADRLVVLESGRVMQTGTPVELRNRPRSHYVASLVGLNLLSGRIGKRDGHAVLDTGAGELAIGGVDLPLEAPALATIHPRAITLSIAPQRPTTSARNVLQARVEDFDLEGDRVRLILDSRPPLAAEITAEAFEDLRLRRDTMVWASIKATGIEVYSA
jgi:molybdate transport system ATP-binding protein